MTTGPTETPVATQSPNTTGEWEVLVVLLTRVLLLACGVVTQSLLAYMLLPEGRGAYAVCITFGVLLSYLFTPGSDRGAQYFVMGRRLTVSQGVAIALLICLVGSGLATALALPLVHSGLDFFQKADTYSFYAALALVPLTSISQALEMQLAGLRRFTRLMRILVARSVVVILALALLVGVLGLGVAGAVASLAVGHLFLIVACLWDLRRHCGLKFEATTRRQASEVIGYGLKHHVAGISSALGERVGNLLLGLSASRAEIGLFSAGSAIMTRVLVLPYAVATPLQPRVAIDERGRPEIAALCARVTWWAAGLCLIALVVISAPLIRILLSEAFLPAASLVWIMAIGLFAYAGADVFLAYFRGTNRPGICSWAVWLGLVANVLSFFTLYPPYGIEGAAWAMTIGFVVRSVYLIAMYRRVSGMNLSSLWLPQPGDLNYLWTSGRRLIRLVFSRQSAHS